MKKLLAIIFILSLFVSCTPKDYLKESKSDKEKRMEWWTDAKFGMFIHWGIYSVPAGWYKGEMVPGISEWIMDAAKIPKDEYEKFAAEFNPVDYDAEKWVKIAKQAGMKYIVITSKHHDGFCIWDSKITNYDVVDFTPYKKDILKPLAAACKKEGIKLGFYHSIMDWHHPNENKENFAKYRDEYLIPQLDELLEEFPEISILWFDGEWIDEWTEDQGKSLYNHLRNIRPDLIINNRIGKGRDGMQGMSKEENSAGDFGTPEQEILETTSAFPWESCMTMNNSWGFKKGDENWKSAETIIQNIIDITAKGGNYLLNVGPDSKGNIPQASVERLAKVGDWMSKYSEGIYGTRPLKNYFEGENIKYTKAKDADIIYAFILSKPINETVKIKYVTPVKNSKMNILGMDELNYTTAGFETVFQLPSDLKETDFPICVKINGKENNIASKPVVKVDGKEIKNSFLFQENVTLEITGKNENGEIRFTNDGSVPDKNSQVYSAPINLTESAKLNSITFKDGFVESAINAINFYRIKTAKNMELKNQPAEKYADPGKLILLNGIRGTERYNDGNWLGFEGNNFETLLDLGEVKSVKNITLGCLSNLNSWIFLPKKVSFFISNDNVNFKKVYESNYELLKSEIQKPFIKDVSSKVNAETRFIKIVAENIKECPSWHKGSGGKAWLFTDEIIID